MFPCLSPYVQAYKSLRETVSIIHKGEGLSAAWQVGLRVARVLEGFHNSTIMVPGCSHKGLRVLEGFHGALLSASTTQTHTDEATHSIHALLFLSMSWPYFLGPPDQC